RTLFRARNNPRYSDFLIIPIQFSCLHGRTEKAAPHDFHRRNNREPSGRLGSSSTLGAPGGRVGICSSVAGISRNNQGNPSSQRAALTPIWRGRNVASRAN
ncbi:MAG: hypothetical protein ACJ746_10225, partial [Bryobacteraceae bacterium]